MDYKFIGIINALLLVILLMPFLLNALNRKWFKTKNETYRKVLKGLRTIHKPTGIALALFGVIHGWMALGGLRLHTGTLLYAAILVQAALGGAFYKTKRKNLFKAHRLMALAVVLLFLLHRLAPSALYCLLN